ncbi:hypothetical protein D3C76_1023850 [compost metagenome]
MDFVAYEFSFSSENNGQGNLFMFCKRSSGSNNGFQQPLNIMGTLVKMDILCFFLNTVHHFK